MDKLRTNPRHRYRDLLGRAQFQSSSSTSPGTSLVLSLATHRVGDAVRHVRLADARAGVEARWRRSKSES
jgi:hypothetical protein